MGQGVEGGGGALGDTAQPGEQGGGGVEHPAGDQGVVG